MTELQRKPVRVGREAILHYLEDLKVGEWVSGLPRENMEVDKEGGFVFVSLNDESRYSLLTPRTHRHVSLVPFVVIEHSRETTESEHGHVGILGVDPREWDMYCGDRVFSVMGRGYLDRPHEYYQLVFVDNPFYIDPSQGGKAY